MRLLRGFQRQSRVSRRLLSISSIPDNAVVAVSFSRTPIGNFSGALSTLSATRLGSLSIESAITKCGIDKNLIEEAFIGNVISAGLGQAPARQAVLGAGLPNTIPCTTINKVCASGMKATMLASLSISSGYRNIVLAGGMESMSNIPHYLLNSRTGYRLGNQTITDGLIHDGLWDVYSNQHMGSCGESCASTYNISRQAQDDFAKLSNERAIDAWNTGKFQDEVSPVTITVKKQDKVIDKDEGIANYDPKKMSSLRPAFFLEGTLTAGNSSKLSDGAAAMILMSHAQARELQLKPLFRILGFGDAARDPVEFTTAPSLAVPLAVKHAGNGLTLKDIQYHEVNEAFAVVSLVNAQLLKLPSDMSTLNVHGGAVAIGHPLGASGARIIGALYNVLMQKDATIGCASICNGGGGASAIIIERLN